MEEHHQSPTPAVTNPTPIINPSYMSLFFSRLADAQDEIHKLRSKAGLIDDYERQVRNLRDELSLASTKKSYLDK